MTIVAPLYLWLFLPLALIVLWRLWRANESRAEISTSQIWRELLAEGAHVESARRQISLRVVIEALTATLLILALAQLSIRESDSLIVVVDRQGSMSAPSRIIAADQRASEIQRSASESVRITHMNSSRGNLARSLTNHLAEANWNGERVELITDYLDGTFSFPANWSISCVDSSVKNAGILAARGETLKDGRVELFVAIGRTPTMTTDACLVQVKYGEQTPQRLLPTDGKVRSNLTLFLDPAPAVDHMTIKLANGDDLSFDDEMTLQRPAPSHRLVIAASQKVDDSASLVAVQDAAQALGMSPYVESEDRLQSNDTFVTMGRPRPEIHGNMVLASTVPASRVLTASTQIKHTGQLLEKIPGLMDWRASRVFEEPLPARFSTLLGTVEGAVAIFDRGSNTIHFAVDPAAEGWTSTATFPLFVRSALASLGVENGGHATSWLATQTSNKVDGMGTLPDPNETLATTSPTPERGLPKRTAWTRSLSSWLAAAAFLLLLGLGISALRA